MKLRQALPSDASSIAALSIEVWLGTYLRTGVNGFFADYVLAEFSTQDIETIISNPQEHIIVSQNEDGIDGFIRISQERPAPVTNGPQTEISTFYVQPRHHGKGRGAALLDAALLYCKDNSVSEIWLATNAENTPAIGFYLAQGFKQVGHTRFVLGDQKYPNNVYARQV